MVSTITASGMRSLLRAGVGKCGPQGSGSGAQGSAAGSKLMAMSLDGLRAWIGLVERKLTMRTRVFLVLVAIAIGGAGAAIVLAIDAQDNAVSKDDLQAVRDELTGTSAPAGAPQTSELEAEIETLRGEVAALRSETAAPEAGSGEAEKPSGESEDATGGAAAPADRQEREKAFERFKDEASK